MIEEYSNNNNNENKHYISPADIVGYYHVEYKDKKVKLEQLPFSY